MLFKAYNTLFYTKVNVFSWIEQEFWSILIDICQKIAIFLIIFPMGNGKFPGERGTLD